MTVIFTTVFSVACPDLFIFKSNTADSAWSAERERETDRQTDRQTDREKGKEREREREREKERDRDRERDRELVLAAVSACLSTYEAEALNTGSSIDLLSNPVTPIHRTETVTG